VPETLPLYYVALAELLSAMAIVSDFVSFYGSEYSKFVAFPFLSLVTFLMLFVFIRESELLHAEPTFLNP
jgi:hypothetical protein